MYVMCICIYNIKRVYVCIYTYLYTHTHTYLQKSLKRISVSSQFKGHPYFNYIQYYYDFPSVISNFCYTYAGCYVMN